MSDTIVLNPAQNEAVQAARDLRRGEILVILGSAGSGKSTVIDHVKNVVEAPTLMAPTHTAKRVMTDITGLQAMTYHKGLGIVPDGEGEFYTNGKVNGQATAIFDETSMMPDKHLTRATLMLQTGRMIFLGDEAQLPPVGADQMFTRWFTARGGVKVIRLQQVMRQANDNPLLNLALQYRHGEDARISFPTSNVTSGAGGFYLDTKDGAMRNFRKYREEGHNVLMVSYFNRSVNSLNQKFRMDFYGDAAAEWPFLMNEPIVASGLCLRADRFSDYLEFKRQMRLVRDKKMDFKDVTADPFESYVALENGQEGVVVGATRVVGHHAFGSNDVWELKIRVTETGKTFPVWTMRPDERAFTVERERRHHEALSEDDRKENRLHMAYYFHLADIRAPFVCSIHKSQGRTVDVCFVDMVSVNAARTMRTGSQELWNRLAYVALSRPKHIAVGFA
ncbi:ATP-dependent DNA helicase [Shimia aestuarii]|uniref:AAA domain-containing protein n=1 Tax=Shimia aestuarii TaxID=254406 RepID=A0A1I4IQ95_9RHOB|nr:AAA family ATPase [Shimia aestuarii]SFL56011.1 AAA domain-containing protein [Shimia aestuarii]